MTSFGYNFLIMILRIIVAHIIIKSI